MIATETNAKEIARILKKVQKVAVFGHVTPDSDCYASAFSMKIALESEGKKVFSYLKEEIPEQLSFFRQYGNFASEKEVQDVDVVLVFDSSALNRVEASEILKSYKEIGIPIYVVDHHLPGGLEDFAEFIWENPEISSTSQMVLAILKELGVSIKKDIATFLLTGIEDDTSSFQNQNTTEESLLDAAYLMSKGARFKPIIDNTFYSKKNINILKMYGLTLERLVYNKKYGTATSYLTFEDLQGFQMEESSLSGVVNFLNVLGDAKMIVLISEHDEDKLKVSLRTRAENVNVQKLAGCVGGGGHIRASGFTLKGRIEKKDGRVRVK